MRTIFSILTILILTMGVGYGQTNIYHPFPDSNAFWSDRGTNMFHPFFLRNTRYGLKGDTIINSKTYHQVFSLFDSTLSNPNSFYYAAIREEDRKIYTIIGNSPETILYDFNLNVGDTITYTYPEIFSRVLSKIDSVQLYTGEYRKRYVFNPIDFMGVPDIVVEGIGSVVWTGLFNPLVTAIATNGDSFDFTCFKQNEIIYYLNNPECDHCFCTLLTEIEDMKEKEKLSVYPNPLLFQTTLQTDYYLHNATILLYNSLGQKVREVKNISGKTFILKRENLPVGIYFFELTQDNKSIFMDKLVISD